MKTVKKILITIVTIILILVLVFNIYNFVQIKILKKDLATINGYAILEVVTGSMEPTIKTGDLIVINTKDKNIKEKDIITFYDVNDAFVTHRLIKIDGDMMITKGDNNNTEDEALPIKNIVGKYVFKISGLGILIASLQKPFVSIMIFIIGILVCFLVSTDKNGNPILEEDKKEFQEFLELKNKQDSSNKKKFNIKEEVNKIKEKVVKEDKKKKKGTPKKKNNKKKKKKRKK